VIRMHGNIRPHSPALTHLQQLEAEAIHIIREAVAESDNPVMLYSIGKDSSVLLHLARKAFYPGKPPFPILHIDTGWKFSEMIAFRDARARALGLDLIVHINQDGVARGINPITHGSDLHTDVMKTQALRQALDSYGFDLAFGGARRDEEKSRAKERIFSFRNAHHRWDPKRQRPEPWQLFNGRKRRGESIRVFPLSNWTEIDVWQYINVEHIPIVPLYFAKEREVVVRGEALILLEQSFVPLLPGERPQIIRCRMRSLGCSPCTGAVRSEADTVPKIIEELVATKYSERQLRVIDHELVHLSAETAHDAFNQVDMMVSSLEGGEFLDDPQNFLHVSRRQLLDGGLVEELTLTNFVNSTVKFVLELSFDADFADLAYSSQIGRAAFEHRLAIQPVVTVKRAARFRVDHPESDGVGLVRLEHHWRRVP